MSLRTLGILLAISLELGFRASAQQYDTNGVYVETFVGSGIPGFLNGQGQETEFNDPAQITADSSGNLYVYDSGNGVIRKVSPGGTVSTYLTVLTDSAYLAGPIAIDRSNNLWTAIAESGNGTYPSYSFYVYGTNGVVSQVISLTNSRPAGICFDSGNNAYYSVPSTYTIYCYKPGVGAEVFAGSGARGEMDGNGIFTEFFEPTALACDEANNIYVADSSVLRKIDQDQNVTTITNSTSSVFAVDHNGNVLCWNDVQISEITATTNALLIAGPNEPPYYNGYSNGPGNVALFEASGACLSQGMIFVADSSNERIRSISFNPVPQQVAGANLAIANYAGVTITGLVGRTYQVQSSPDMTNWSAAASLLLTSNPYLWFDTNSLAGSKFYRAFLMP